MDWTYPKNNINKEFQKLLTPLPSSREPSEGDATKEHKEKWKLKMNVEKSRTVKVGTGSVIIGKPL